MQILFYRMLIAIYYINYRITFLVSLGHAKILKGQNAYSMHFFFSLGVYREFKRFPHQFRTLRLTNSVQFTF